MHDFLIFLFGFKNQGAGRIYDHLKQNDMDRTNQHRQSEHQRQKRQPGNRDMGREDELHRLADIVINPAPKPDCTDDRAEFVIEQHQ